MLQNKPRKILPVPCVGAVDRCVWEVFVAEGLERARGGRSDGVEGDRGGVLCIWDCSSLATVQLAGCKVIDHRCQTK